jgi:hypothetical protein
MLDKDIAELMGIVPNDFNEPVIRGGAFDDVKDQTSPFGFQKCEGKHDGHDLDDRLQQHTQLSRNTFIE